MRNITLKTGIILFVVASFCGCDKVKEIANMFNCTFERKNIDNFRIAKVNFDHLTSPSDLTIADGINITQAILTKTIPVTFNMNIEGKNPTKSLAAIEQFRWKFLLDGNEILEGNVENTFSIPAEGTNILPLEISFDAMNYLDGSGTVESIFKFYQNITGKNASGESNATLKIKPTINGMEFPNYITVNQTVN